jgi:hypothetical protein
MRMRRNDSLPSHGRQNATAFEDVPPQIQSLGEVAIRQVRRIGSDAGKGSAFTLPPLYDCTVSSSPPDSLTIS